MFYLFMLTCFRLADLAMEFELERPPTVDDLLTVIINREDVEALIGRPVSQLVLASKYKSQKGYKLKIEQIISLCMMLVVRAVSSSMFFRYNFRVQLTWYPFISILSVNTQNSHWKVSLSLYNGDWLKTTP